MNEKLNFASDYTKGAHSIILKRLTETNLLQTTGYGRDEISESARNRIRKACGRENAVVEFLMGGTQTNAVLLDALLRSYQGVVSAETGHVNGHEAGAVEATGHKILTLPQRFGKLTPESVEKYLDDYYRDAKQEHMVEPAAVYLSHPTEYGTLYTEEELRRFRRICDKHNTFLYVDGARLAYALACPENDVTLPVLAETSDAFYIGGTKCGALFGEAAVVPNPERVRRLFTTIKRRGALLAKGRLLGIQFDEMFKDDLYMRIGEPAIKTAEIIRRALREKGYRLYGDSPTNQIFCVVENDDLCRLSEKVEFGLWEEYDATHTVIRFATDWGTTEEEANALIDVL